jgi:hypothetical protein
MSKEQTFMVAWTTQDDEERHETFNTLLRARVKYESLKARDYDHYVYLSVVIEED